MVKAKSIHSSELGTHCWLPARHLGMCYTCLRYHKCKYPERVRNEHYEHLMRRVVEAQQALTRASEELHKFISGR